MRNNKLHLPQVWRYSIRPPKPQKFKSMLVRINCFT
nr:MAG TPA: hypothetical protein [Caudoviricetes sp.]